MSPQYDVWFDPTLQRFNLPGVGSGTSGIATSSSEASHTHSVTIPAHTHNLTYGLHPDSTRPDDLTIKVNGSTVASGVTLNAGNDYTYELDITSTIKAAANLRQEHTIVVEAGSGQGLIQLQVQCLKVIQPVEV